MTGVNLSEWALRHRTLVVYTMLLALVGGVLSYIELGREEDPQFAIMTMIVQTNWPGATTLETMQQVTERIEKKLEETPSLDYIKSYTKPGISVVYVNLLEFDRPQNHPGDLVSGPQESGGHQGHSAAGYPGAFLQRRVRRRLRHHLRHHIRRIQPSRDP